MKKHILSKLSVFLLIVATLFSAFAVMAFAADTSAGISSNVTSVKKGQVITVSVKLNNAENVRSIGIEFDFDANVFEALNSDSTDNAGWRVTGGFAANYNTPNKQAGVGFAEKTNLNGEIFILTLKVKDNAILGNQTISAFVRVTTSDDKKDYQAGSISLKIECNHTGGTATCTEQKTCDLCGEKYGDYAHTYNCEVAEDRYLKSPANCVDAAVYFKSCACGAIGTTTFVYGTSADHVFTENIDDAYLKTPASCTAKAVYVKSCPGCGLEGTETFEAGEMLPHSFGSEWLKDENGHWNECTCGAKGNEEAHTWDAGIVTKGATESEEGEKTYTCTKCYGTKIESIDKIPSQSANQNQSENDTIIWIVLCAIGAVVIVVLVIMLISKKPTVADPVVEKISENKKQ